MGRKADEPYEAVPNRSGFWPAKVVKKSAPNETLFIGHKKQCAQVAELLSAAYREGRRAGNRFVE